MTDILNLAIPLICLYLVIKILGKPIKWIFKLLFNTALGFVCLFLLNYISGTTGVLFEINFVTAAIVGVLGVPGILLLLVINYLM